MTDLNGVSAFPRISKVQLADLLKQKYPDREWEKVFLMRGKYSQQRRLEHAMKAIFPVILKIEFPDSFLSNFPLKLAADMIINARKEAGLINRETGEFLELDVFLPSLKLAIEYQVWYIKKATMLTIQNRKNIITSQHNIIASK